VVVVLVLAMVAMAMVEMTPVVVVTVVVLVMLRLVVMAAAVLLTAGRTLEKHNAIINNVFARRTDGRTNRRIEFSSLDRVLIA